MTARMRKIEILRTDWERVRRARPTFDEDKLVRELLLRGRRLIREEPQESILPDAASEQRLAWLRRWTPRIEVDDYQPVEFEGQEEKRKTLEFFRRIGGDR